MNEQKVPTVLDVYYRVIKRAGDLREKGQEENDPTCTAASQELDAVRQDLETLPEIIATLPQSSGVSASVGEAPAGDPTQDEPVGGIVG